MSALMTACKHNKVESVEILIKAKADLNKKCESGLRGTPMHYAADKKYLDLMKMLKDAGADSSVKNSRGHTPADMVMLNFDEYLDDYAHTSLNIAADRQLKQLPNEEVTKEPEPLPEEGTDSEIEEDEHLEGWSAPKEESIHIKRVESQAEIKEKKIQQQQKSQKDLAAAKSPKKYKEKKEKKKKRKKRSKKSKRRKKSNNIEDDGGGDDDDDRAGPARQSEMSPEDRLANMLSKNENKLDMIREAFSDHDIDDSGFLDRPEFMSCLGSLGMQEQLGRNFKTHVEKTFMEFDKDQNGRISFEEFVQFYNTINNSTRARVHTRKNANVALERPKAASGRRKGKGEQQGVDPRRSTNFTLPSL
jgi:hypothetical protein